MVQIKRVVYVGDLHIKGVGLEKFYWAWQTEALCLSRFIYRINKKKTDQNNNKKYGKLGGLLSIIMLGQLMKNAR